MKQDTARQLVGKSILCVEDEKLISRMYKRGLSLAGASVTGATDGMKALDLLEKQSFDVIILDLQMPNMNGFELVEILRTKPQLNHIPVIILSNGSAVSREEAADSFKDNGVVDVLLKCNVPISSLIDRICKLFEEPVTKEEVKL